MVYNTFMKRKKKGESTILQEKLWELCKQYIRKIYPNECYTCDEKGLKGINWQTGHYIAKGALKSYLKYDPRVLRPQCMRCNVHHGGMGADYHIRMLKEEGQKYIDGIHEDRKKVLKPKETIEHYKQMIEWYKSQM